MEDAGLPNEILTSQGSDFVWPRDSRRYNTYHSCIWGDHPNLCQVDSPLPSSHTHIPLATTHISLPICVRLIDIQDLRKERLYRKATKGNSLTDWLKRVTGLALMDKGNKKLRLRGWNTMDPLDGEKKTYAAYDGMASWILGMWC